MWHFQRDVIRLHWKGAAEIVLALCTSWIDVDGSNHEMTPDKVGILAPFQICPLHS
jgi:Ca2+-transporting ATPase